ncbi:MAG: hypothetical protein D6689_13805 [Deltaproteobacteria bacterium]|nr:MAG: hypothetical protein D6689_13805 [Deltaproteobacteria bacterium]
MARDPAVRLPRAPRRRPDYARDMRTVACWAAAAAASVAVASMASAGRAGRAVVVVRAEPDMVRIPAGPFWMGFPDDPAARSELRADCVREFGDGAQETVCTADNLVGNARPLREVYLPAYDIDRYEVTVGAYRACAAAGYCDVAPLVTGDGRFVADDRLPIVYVTWRDAADYCAWAGKRLPTEAEWEKAARGVDRRPRPWPWGYHRRDDGSNHGAVDRHAVWLASRYVADASDGFTGPAPVGALRWSASPYGVYDLAGNVSEWVADYYAPTYEALSHIDPAVTAPPAVGPPMRVVRGGSWAEPRLFGRTYLRLYADANHRGFDRGFRCARDAR